MDTVSFKRHFILLPYAVCEHHLLLKIGSMSATQTGIFSIKVQLLCQTLLVDREGTLVMVTWPMLTMSLPVGLKWQE